MKIENPLYYSAVRSDVISIVPIKKYKRILEIGGGESNTLLELAKLNQSEGWAIDLINVKHKNIKAIKGSIEDETVAKKIPDQYFDLILACDLLEHLTDTDHFFSLMHKKLTKNGLLILSVPNIRQLRSLFYLFIKGSFPRYDAGLFDKTHLRWFCKKDVINFASNNRFTLVDYKSVGRFVPNMLNQSVISEFLALQNIFVFKKNI